MAGMSRRIIQWTLVCASAAAIALGCIDQQKEVDNYKQVLQPRQGRMKTRIDYSHGEELHSGSRFAAGQQRLRTTFGSSGETAFNHRIQRPMPTPLSCPRWSLADLSMAKSPRAGRKRFQRLDGHQRSAATLSNGNSSSGYTAAVIPMVAQANLFNGFRDVSTLQANQFNVKNQRYTLLNLQATVLLETAQTYYNVLLAERSVVVLAKSTEYQDALVADQQARFHAGIAQPLDVAQSEAQAAATHAQLITAQDSVQTNRAMLEFMTNAKVHEASLVDRLEVPQKIPNIEDAVKIAEQERLDILAAAEVVRVEQQNLQVAIGEYYPSVSLDLNYYLHRETFPTNVEWAGIITASIPIFSAGEIRADVRNAMSQLRTAVYNQWQLIREVRQNVLIDWNNLIASRNRIKQLIIEVNASQEALRQARERYNVGLAINLDVLNAITQLLTAQLSLAQEEFNYKVFYLDLLRATWAACRCRRISSRCRPLPPHAPPPKRSPPKARSSPQMRQRNPRLRSRPPIPINRRQLCPRSTSSFSHRWTRCRPPNLNSPSTLVGANLVFAHCAR